MTIEIFRCGVDRPAAHLLGIGVCLGDQIHSTIGSVHGLRATFGFWFFIVYVWLWRKEIS